MFSASNLSTIDLRGLSGAGRGEHSLHQRVCGRQAGHGWGSGAGYVGVLAAGYRGYNRDGDLGETVLHVPGS